MGAEPEFHFRIIKIPSVIAPKVIDYIEDISYETHSRKSKEFVTRNAFKILKIEAVHDGTLLHLELFGREREKRYQELKTFVEQLERKLEERVLRSAPLAA